jgi:serine/threonine-protein kinase
VVRAIERESGRVVALKRLHPQLASDAARIREFLREARIAQGLCHPNIVKVHGVGQIDGLHYMSMEWIPGESLYSLMEERRSSSPFPVGVAIWILSELLKALDHVSAGTEDARNRLPLVHRDLSPSNVIITPGGEVKLIDFGLAKSLSGRYATQSGIAKGQLGYMAPETLAGTQAGTCSDLYSLAVLAWELLANRRLYGGEAWEQLARRAAHRFIAPSSLRPGISRDLDDLIAVGLAIDPGDRWPSAAAMAGVLTVATRRYRREAGPEAWISWRAQDYAQATKLLHAVTATVQCDLGLMTTLPVQPARGRGRYCFGPSSNTVMDPVDDPTGRHRQAVAADK